MHNVKNKNYDKATRFATALGPFSKVPPIN